MTLVTSSVGKVTATDSPPATLDLPDGLVAFVKRDCPTCRLVAPVLAELSATRGDLTVVSQDDPSFPDEVAGVADDTSLRLSFLNDIETVPTVIRIVNGAETARIVGWDLREWTDFAEGDFESTGLPDFKPGCGSLSVDPEHSSRLEATYGRSLRSRRVDFGSGEDPHEAMFDRGWSDGLPLVPPTPERVARMLTGTSRAADEVVAIVPPDLVDCTVEKVAVNAVMAGCRPEYLPVVLAAVEAACTDEFNMHGLLATTMSNGPVLIVNGPIADEIGMNSGFNVLGQGNRANMTIGRALQLVIRNVGGGRPGEIDRATLGNPGKLGFCFAEDEAGSPWEPLAQELGIPAGVSAVTLFPGEGPRIVMDQLSRDPNELARSLAANLRATVHPKLALAFDAILVVSPEHAARFEEAGWSKDDLRAAMAESLTLDMAEAARGASGIAEGLPAGLEGPIPKFRDGGLLIVHAGSNAGLFSAIIGGWANGATGSQYTTREISP